MDEIESLNSDVQKEKGSEGRSKSVSSPLLEIINHLRLNTQVLTYVITPKSLLNANPLVEPSLKPSLKPD